MRQLFRKIFTYTTSNHVRRHFQTTSGRCDLHEDGKTTISFLSKDAASGLQIKSAQPWGFVLNTGSNIFGSLVMFPRSLIAWNVGSVEDINEDTLTLFSVLEPKPDIVVFGFNVDCDPRLRAVKDIKQLMQKWGIAYEILPTTQAISVYNFLNADRKYVAAALLPPIQKTTVFQRITRLQKGEKIEEVEGTRKEKEEIKQIDKE